MAHMSLDVLHVRDRVALRPQPMSVHKRTSSVAIARRLKEYHAGDRVRILRGQYAGQVMTVYQSANDWVTLNEVMKRDPSRWVMSKGNVEPESGFTQDEMNQAERISRRGGEV